ncbi:9947_t:CDS:1, partial [Dentiscutata erythropus]
TKALAIYLFYMQLVKLYDTLVKTLNKKCQIISGQNKKIDELTEIIFGTNVWNAGYTWK